MDSIPMKVSVHEHAHTWREFFKTAYRSYGDRSNVEVDPEYATTFAEAVAKNADEMMEEYIKRFPVTITMPTGCSPKLIRTGEGFETVQTLPKVRKEDVSLGHASSEDQQRINEADDGFGVFPVREVK